MSDGCANRPAGTVVSCHLKMSVNVGVTSPSYVIADDMVRIITVPVPYQNGSIEDPDTPPTPEAKLLKGIGNKVAFKYDSDGHIIAFSQEWYSNGVHSSTVEVVIKWTNGNIANYESVVYRPDGTSYSQEIGIPYIYSYY